MNLKSACLLLSLCHAGSAAALGLGELSVRSHLGQTLHVTVKILGAGATTAADCFSLASSEGAAVPPPRAQFSLEQGSSQALLHIRTAYAINDPIAQFALISDCESRLRRDYVVLLDPPALVAPVPSRDVPDVTAQERVAHSAPAPAVSRIPARKPKVKRTAVTPSPAASSPQSPASRKQVAQDYQTPRLVLSGRHGMSGASLALRLDTNLPDLNRPPVDNLTPDELSDENTALTRKLAHLETQLVALQKRNAEIESKRTGGPTSQTPSPASLSPKWPLYLLIVGLLAAAGILIVWLRRRGRSAHTAERTAWFSASSAPAPDLERMPADPWTQPSPKQTESPSEVEPVLEFLPSTSSPTTEVNDNIVDQVEVYMAHGHGDLAIHLLQEHLRETPDESPVPWLLLLDLLHRDNDTENYKAASIECRRHFNVNLSGHPVSQDNETSQGLEAYPHLLEQLVVVWGSPAVEEFFTDLIYDKRGGTRVGFDPGAYREILLLRAISQDVHPLTS